MLSTPWGMECSSKGTTAPCTTFHPRPCLTATIPWDVLAQFCTVLKYRLLLLIYYGMPGAAFQYELGMRTGCPDIWGPAPKLELELPVSLRRGIFVSNGCPHTSNRHAGTCSCETCTFIFYVVVIVVEELTHFRWANVLGYIITLMSCELAEKAITADFMAFRHCPKSGSYCQRALWCLVSCTEA